MERFAQSIDDFQVADSTKKAAKLSSDYFQPPSASLKKERIVVLGSGWGSHSFLKVLLNFIHTYIHTCIHIYITYLYPFVYILRTYLHKFAHRLYIQYIHKNLTTYICMSTLHTSIHIHTDNRRPTIRCDSYIPESLLHFHPHACSQRCR